MTKISIQIQDMVMILDKIYYSIGEVANIFGVATSLLRHWETEFHQLKPNKSRSGSRRYTQQDIQLIHKIYTLTKEQGYTLEGAKKALVSISHREESINELRNRLLRLKADIQKLNS